MISSEERVCESEYYNTWENIKPILLVSSLWSQNLAESQNKGIYSMNVMMLQIFENSFAC